MLTNETISKLQDMRLGVMAKQFKEQMDDPQFASMSFEDRKLLPVYPGFSPISNR